MEVPVEGLDLVAAEDAFRRLIEAFGMKDNEEVMANTPRRFVEAYAELFTAHKFVPTVFANEEQYDGMVLVRSIPFRSVCEHHFLPFSGTTTVAYIPSTKIVGISKLARAVEFYSQRPQRQERLTVEVVQWLEDNVQPKGAGVLMAAQHACMALRGARAEGATTVTSAFRGLLSGQSQQRRDFMLLVTDTGGACRGAW